MDGVDVVYGTCGAGARSGSGQHISPELLHQRTRVSLDATTRARRAGRTYPKSNCYRRECVGVGVGVGCNVIEIEWGRVRVRVRVEPVTYKHMHICTYLLSSFYALLRPSVFCVMFFPVPVFTVRVRWKW